MSTRKVSESLLLLKELKVNKYQLQECTYSSNSDNVVTPLFPGNHEFIQNSMCLQYIVMHHASERCIIDSILTYKKYER